MTSLQWRWAGTFQQVDAQGFGSCARLACATQAKLRLAYYVAYSDPAKLWLLLIPPVRHPLIKDRGGVQTFTVRWYWVLQTLKAEFPSQIPTQMLIQFTTPHRNASLVDCDLQLVSESGLRNIPHALLKPRPDFAQWFIAVKRKTSYGLCNNGTEIWILNGLEIQ